jgi:hypothetical protein
MSYSNDRRSKQLDGRGANKPEAGSPKPEAFKLYTISMASP